MERWQRYVLFWVVVAGAIAVFFADQLGIKLDTLKLSGLGAITTYVLADGRWGRKRNEDDDEHKPSHRGGAE